LEALWQELTSGLHDGKLIHVIIRLFAAALLGSLIGIQRESSGKPAGLRTHMFVSLGTALFVVSCTGAGMSPDTGLSRVIQGIITGIGFLGAGSILKLGVEHEIKGLTTAAGVLMTAAIGVTAGLGSLGIALIATILTLIIFWLHRFEHKGHMHQAVDQTNQKHEGDL